MAFLRHVPRGDIFVRNYMRFSPLPQRAGSVAASHLRRYSSIYPWGQNPTKYVVYCIGAAFCVAVTWGTPCGWRLLSTLGWKRLGPSDYETNQSINQSIAGLEAIRAEWLRNEPINQSITRPANLSIYRSIDQSKLDKFVRAAAKTITYKLWNY